MSFWKFKSAFAPPPTDGIERILSTLPSDAIPAEPFIASGSSTSLNSPPEADPTPFYAALDELLVESDLLNEIKSGSNAKLIDFLSRREAILRLGGWVVWGLGRGMELKHAAATSSVEMDHRGSLLESGVLPDDLEDGKVPDDVVKAEAERERVGMGGTPRRKEVDFESRDTSEESEATAPTAADEEETKQEKCVRCSLSPRANRRVLMCITASCQFSPARDGDSCGRTTQFDRRAFPTRVGIFATSPVSGARRVHPAVLVSLNPCACAAKDADACWFASRESVLGSTEQQLAVRASQVGFWARINSVLLDGPNGRQVQPRLTLRDYWLPG